MERNKLDLREEILKYMKESAPEVTVESIAEAFCVDNKIAEEALSFLLKEEAVNFTTQMVYIFKKNVEKERVDKNIVDYLSNAKVVTIDVFMAELDLDFKEAKKVLRILSNCGCLINDCGFIYKNNPQKENIKITKRNKKGRVSLFENDEEKFEMNFRKTNYVTRAQIRTNEESISDNLFDDDDDDYDWLSNSPEIDKCFNEEEKLGKSLTSQVDLNRNRWQLYFLYVEQHLNIKKQKSLCEKLMLPFSVILSYLKEMPCRIERYYEYSEIKELQEELYEEYGIVCGISDDDSTFWYKEGITSKNFEAATIQLTILIISISFADTKDIAAEQTLKIREYAKNSNNRKCKRLFNKIYKEFKKYTAKEYKELREM